MDIDIDSLNEEELVELNNKIVARLRFLSQARAHKAMLRFNIGDRVSFQPPNRPAVSGTLVKYNRKSVTVVTDSGQSWNVAPGLLAREDDAAGAQKDGKVIPLRKK